MPRLQDRNPYKALSKALAGAREYERFTTADIAEAIGVSQPTALKYMRHPETAPLGKLLAMRRKLHIPIEELREHIPG